jgi:predicted amidohydrolase YtcJ
MLHEKCRLTRTCVPAVAALVLAAAACARAPQDRLAPDAIYVGGPVITMDSAGTIAEAVAVFGDRIVAVGTRGEVERMAGPRTRVIDLEGRALAPGFYAPHDHFPRIGTLSLYQVNLNSPPMGTVETIDDVVRALAAKAEAAPPGTWIRGRGYDDTLLEERRHPTRHDLDRASTTHPIWIVHTSGHLGVANTLALTMAGVDAATRAPANGVIRKDPATGEPTGVLEERAMSLVSRLVPALGREQQLEAIAWASEHYLSRGVTTAVIAGGGRQNLLNLQEARRRGTLRLRVIQMLTGPAVPGRNSFAETAGLLSGFGDDWIRVGAIKLMQDGSIQGYTGYLAEPYHVVPEGQPGYRGYPRHERDNLIAIVGRLHCKGYQLAIHGNGDAAIDDILDAYEAAQAECPRPDARHRIEHAQMARPDQVERMARLGVSPSFFVGHVFYWGDRHRDIFQGPERAARTSPLRTALDHGLRITAHDDTPVTPVDPLHSIWVAVNRRTRSGQVLGPEQRISAAEAMRLFTIDAAWQNFEERSKGSIEPGKLADMVILSDNPLAVDPMAIRDIRVLETIVGGRTAYRAGR